MIDLAVQSSQMYCLFSFIQLIHSSIEQPYISVQKHLKKMRTWNWRQFYGKIFLHPIVSWTPSI